MKVELVGWTTDAEHKIAQFAKETRKRTVQKIEDNYPQETVEKDRDFIRRRINDAHFGILEHAYFTFRIQGISRVLSHQLVRHRLASFLQMNSRYVLPGKENYVTPATIIKNGCRKPYNDYMEKAYAVYKHLHDAGVPLEDARYALPPAFFTHITMTCNARELRHIISVRLDPAAQWEIKELVNRIIDIVREKFPTLVEDIENVI